MTLDAFKPLIGTSWTGTGELWMDPLGNTANTYPCTLNVAAGEVAYTWDFEGKTKQGRFSIADGAVRWSDSFHLPDGSACKPVTPSWGMLHVELTYPAPEGPDWGWQIRISQRPDGSLVLQMTNVTPWGEDGRAVRMVFTKSE
jgi:hypothetical protein